MASTTGRLPGVRTSEQRRDTSPDGVNRVGLTISSAAPNRWASSAKSPVPPGHPPAPRPRPAPPAAWPAAQAQGALDHPAVRAGEHVVRPAGGASRPASGGSTSARLRQRRSRNRSDQTESGSATDVCSNSSGGSASRRTTCAPRRAADSAKSTSAPPRRAAEDEVTGTDRPALEDRLDGAGHARLRLRRKARRLTTGRVDHVPARDDHARGRLHRPARYLALLQRAQRAAAGRASCPTVMGPGRSPGSREPASGSAPGSPDGSLARR